MYNIYSDIKSFQCDVCEHKFASKYHYERHIAICGISTHGGIARKIRQNVDKQLEDEKGELWNNRGTIGGWQATDGLYILLFVHLNNISSLFLL